MALSLNRPGTTIILSALFYIDKGATLCHKCPSPLDVIDASQVSLPLLKLPFRARPLAAHPFGNDRCQTLPTQTFEPV